MCTCDVSERAESLCGGLGMDGLGVGCGRKMGWGVQLTDRLFPTSRCTNNPANWPGNVLITFMAFFNEC